MSATNLRLFYALARAPSGLSPVIAARRQVEDAQGAVVVGFALLRADGPFRPFPSRSTHMCIHAVAQRRRSESTCPTIELPWTGVGHVAFLGARVALHFRQQDIYLREACQTSAADVSAIGVRKGMAQREVDEGWHQSGRLVRGSLEKGR